MISRLTALATNCVRFAQSSLVRALEMEADGRRRQVQVGGDPLRAEAARGELECLALACRE
jgi:hypothetical protein